MRQFARRIVALFGAAALGAGPQPHPTRPIATRPLRLSFVDRTNDDRFAPNAIRRARLAYLMSRKAARETMSAAHRAVNGTAASAYTVRNLNAFIRSSGVTIDPLALNDAGQIVGSSSFRDGASSTQGYLVNPSGSNGPLTDTSGLGTYHDDYPVSISNNGQSIAGFGDNYAETPFQETMYTGSLLWTLTGPTSNILTYEDFEGGGLSSVANQNIGVGGAGYVSAKIPLTFFDTSSCAISDFYASAINDAGLIVGTSRFFSEATVLTFGGCPTVVPNVDGNISRADAVAANGDMILENRTTPASRPTYRLWAKGHLYPIPLPSGYDASTFRVDAIALNASDIVVANVLDNNGRPAGAFEYANGRLTDIQTLFPAGSGWNPPFYVTGINDNGEIIGEGYLGNAQTPFALIK